MRAFFSYSLKSVSSRCPHHHGLKASTIAYDEKSRSGIWITALKTEPCEGYGVLLFQNAKNLLYAAFLGSLKVTYRNKKTSIARRWRGRVWRNVLLENPQPKM